MEHDAGQDRARLPFEARTSKLIRVSNVACMHEPLVDAHSASIRGRDDDEAMFTLAAAAAGRAVLGAGGAAMLTAPSAAATSCRKLTRPSGSGATLSDMSEHDAPVGRRLQRYVAEQLHLAMSELELRGHESRRGIHQGRKAVRRARAALLLAWPHPQGGVALALDELKYANDRTSDLRDAHALLGALKSLERSASDKTANALDAARKYLKRTRARLEADADSAARMASARGQIASVAEVMADWPWEDVAMADIRTAVEATTTQVALARAAAVADPSPRKIHKWRRRLRRLVQQRDACVALGIDMPADPVSECWAEQLGRLQDDNVLLASTACGSKLSDRKRKRLRRVLRKARNTQRDRLLSVSRLVG
ncbi:CHAD domain-containing protein [Lysobacter sp. TY2-98]|uniref:CHAD domain-containing protein n=1 Tax=Lysobacter sp. TY2-98 TaxID=2290922 RepID=UPI000E2045CC|nr:CHAD domain-containing protein [Lysobacter sp. TY2-98]AXK71059.1 CHAD domain-containing protein [Lysobacter sp. TY2-98]